MGEEKKEKKKKRENKRNREKKKGLSREEGKWMGREGFMGFLNEWWRLSIKMEGPNGFFEK